MEIQVKKIAAAPDVLRVTHRRRGKPGTAHFRLPLKQGLALYAELGKLISGLGLPAYAVDLPGGGGKIRLYENIIAGEKMTAAGAVYLLKDGSGNLWEYPVE